MKKCLNCNYEFEPTKETKKFCKNSCRVIYFKKHGKKKDIGLTSEQKITIMHNETLQALAEIRKLSKGLNIHVISNKPIVTPKTSWDEYLTTQNEIKPTIALKSFEQFRKEKLECDNIEDWEKLEQEILNSNLSQKQKVLLTKYN